MKRSKKQPLFDPVALSLELARNLNDDLTHTTADAWCMSPSDLFLQSKQAKSFLDKFDSASDPSLLETTAFVDFLDVCNRIQLVNDTFAYPKTCSSRSDQILLRARTLVHSILGDLTEEEFFLNCKHSSGASIGVPYQDTSLEAKSLSPLTCTEGVQRWFKYYLCWDKTLHKALVQQGPVIFKIVAGSKATTVPKDSKKRRMICIEPTLNMFFQQGLMSCMSSRLANAGLSFDVLQNVHRELAQISSITHENATIDWSSASDCVSMSLVRFLLPRTWLHYVETFRCKNISIGGSSIDLPMVSTMGNATTFPLETLVFYCLAVANLTPHFGRSTLVDPELLPLVSVFGDDCIVPNFSAVTYINFMSTLGFLPNVNKSFFTSCGFRESCGGDYLHGVDVRPYYLRAPNNLKKAGLEAWLYVILNRLQNRYIRIYGPLKYIYKSASFSYIFSLFRKYNLSLKVVPTHFPDDSGFKCGSDFARFNRHYPDIPWSPITQNVHGTKHFLSLRFRFPERKAVNDDLRFATSLKEGLRSVDHQLFSLVRRKGGYIVARNRTCFFTLITK